MLLSEINQKDIGYGMEVKHLETGLECEVLGPVTEMSGKIGVMLAYYNRSSTRQVIMDVEDFDKFEITKEKYEDQNTN